MLLLAAMAGATARAGTWSDLWATREQQAQRLLDSKRPAEAASLFGDPRRQAYAELQAGQYDKAAEHLKPFKDADSQYNRGNALAHAGQLQDALAAYDAALANSPGNRDVIRNRDLVARALKQQSQADQKNNAGNSQQGNQGSGQKQSNSAQSGQGTKGEEGQKRDDGAGDQGSQRNSPAQAGNQSQPGNQAQSANQRQPGNRAQQANPSAASGDATADDLEQAAQSQASRANGSDAAQAADRTRMQPQAAAQAESGQRGNSQDNAISANKALPGADSLSQKPRSEQALALDQWLRGIPEDSGELLRRKFLIEHMMKQQGNEQ